MILKALLGFSIFCYIVVWVLGAASTAMQDWSFIGDATSGWREGLWYRCLWSHCDSNNFYTSGCLALLGAVRAFSISTICLAFITMCFLLLIIVREGCYIPATIWGFLTMGAAACPWSIYLGFSSQCQLPGLQHGSGWCLSVSAFPFAVLGFFAQLAWCFLRKREKANRPKTAAPASPAVKGASVTKAPPPVAEPPRLVNAGNPANLPDRRPATPPPSSAASNYYPAPTSPYYPPTSAAPAAGPYAAGTYYAPPPPAPYSPAQGYSPMIFV